MSVTQVEYVDTTLSKYVSKLLMWGCMLRDKITLDHLRYHSFENTEKKMKKIDLLSHRDDAHIGSGGQPPANSW